MCHSYTELQLLMYRHATHKEAAPKCATVSLLLRIVFLSWKLLYITFYCGHDFLSSVHIKAAEMSLVLGVTDHGVWLSAINVL